MGRQSDVVKANLEQTVAFMRAFVEARRWRFAATMPENPHEYTVRKWCPDPPDQEAFEQFVKAIRFHGTDEMWKGYKYRYLDLDGFHYWTMGSPVSETIIINRKQLPCGEEPHEP